MRNLNTHDVFAFVRLINECNLKETLSTELIDLFDGKKQIVVDTYEGMEIIFALISAFGKKGAEQAFYEFLSAPFEMSPNEIENLPPEETLRMIRELASPEGWLGFFKSAVKLVPRK